ncbi:MAG TPA: glycosyltransferase family 39 protein [Blastocatellia bacterium]|nr:glycosyltransferase family 39 protein [Blastocatellia bacterium]
MTNAGLAYQQNRFTGEQGHITRATVLTLFMIIAAVSFILRIFYAGHLYEDDGLWFTAAEEIVRGKALYREIYFDKPPGLALVYAFLFWIFGAHVIAIRLFTIAYSIAISAVLYLFGSRLYDKRVGLLAGGLFAVFSTTYTTGHVQGLGTDFLMALPYAAGAFLLVRARHDRTHQARLAVAGGALAGVAFQMNPKGIFDLIFFAVLLIAWERWAAKGASTDGDSEAGGIDSTTSSGQSSLRLFALAATGLAAGSAPFLVYIATTRSLREYWLYVWDWGARYGSYNPASRVFVAGLTRSVDYFALNNTLLIALIFVGAITVRRGSNRFRRTADQASAADFRDQYTFGADATLLLWLAVSYAGVILGGRLYSHYFFQILPSLCLIGARGLSAIGSALKTRDAAFRRGITAVIVLGFVFTVIRFHGRTAMLAADLLRGKKSQMTAGWFHDRIDREERMVAAAVRELPDGEDAADRVGLEAMREDGPRLGKVNGPTDCLFVWGYRPEIYYFSGLLPASRYLSTQPLTGVPADVHYFGDDYRSVLDEASTALARGQLIRDLQETRPKYIVDELGMFNSGLSINSYPELKEFMTDYKATGAVARFMIYCRRDLLKKNLRRMREKLQ